MLTLGAYAIDAQLHGADGRIVAAVRLESPHAPASAAPPVAERAPAGAAAAAQGKAGASMRDTMPAAAALVDWMRGFLGAQAAAAIVKRGQAGRGGFYVAEIGPDGRLHEFGSTADGRRVVCTDAGALAWVDPAGAPVGGAGDAA